MMSAMEAHRGAIVLFSSGVEPDIVSVSGKATATSCRTILIAENGAELPDPIARSLDGIVYRNVPGTDLLDCIRRVGNGLRSIQGANVTSILAQDTVGARVRERLTPKEVQIIALILQGCKNRQIAEQLGTKEQVIKNYLRSIYDKTGVSDRLELALFTIHHRVLADAVAKAADTLQVMMV
jgi:DNA-binding NarL/FixJ family response regulator